jgi:hypothetical protein
MNAPANVADRVALLTAASTAGMDSGVAGAAALLSQLAEAAAATTRAGFDAQVR